MRGGKKRKSKKIKRKPKKTKRKPKKTKSGKTD